MLLLVAAALAWMIPGGQTSEVSENFRGASARSTVGQEQTICTFSIVAYDPEQQQWGVAVASKFLAVGAVVPWAKAGAGAIATQSHANTSYGPKALELLSQGKSADEVIKQLTIDDMGKDVRQVGIIDAKGNAATFTGAKCMAWVTTIIV